MSSHWLSRSFILLAMVLSTASLWGQGGDPAAGKTIFKNYCGACHNKDMKTDMTGPALGQAEEHWAEYPREDLYVWIRNSQALISAGHPRAVELWEKWKPVQMSPFPNLTDEDIENVLAYIHQEYTKEPVTAGGPGDGVPVEKADYGWLYWVIFVVLAVVAMVLSRLIAQFRYLNELKAGNVDAQKPAFGQMFRSKAFLTFLTFFVLAWLSFTVVNRAINLGRQQGYQPEQPIKFSHKTHAGLHKIDCKFCHDGARRSKHSVIPSANTCMNCHRAIKVGSTYGTAELTKIFASIGYDPTTDSYIENYDQLSNEEIEKIYTKWMRDQYMVAHGDFDALGETAVKRQWEDVVAALTHGEEDAKIQGPIEWVRVHNLPDHVYYNHSQHVEVGGLECQTCHGPVEEMDVLRQYAPLSMGWCVNCHRQTEVKAFKDNPYYQSYHRLHEELKAGKRSKVTVEDIGGTECQKCHY